MIYPEDWMGDWGVWEFSILYKNMENKSLTVGSLFCTRSQRWLGFRRSELLKQTEL